MNAKERWVTILGLAGTFLLPWPGEADRYDDPARDRSTVSAPARAGADRIPARRIEDDERGRSYFVSSARAAQPQAHR